MKVRGVLAAVVLAAAAAVAWYGLSRPSPPVIPDLPGSVVPDRAPDPTPDPPPAAANPRPRPAAESPGEDVLPPPDSHGGREDGHEHAALEDPTEDLVLYAELPMSAVPHHVVRGWGARGAGAVPGVVGAFVVVDPELGDEQLALLARDIRAYHSDAEALSVRILDSQRAASYDRHSDGGALAAAHLVGVVNRNAQLGMDRIEIRGRVVEVTGSSAP